MNNNSSICHCPPAFTGKKCEIKEEQDLLDAEFTRKLFTCTSSSAFTKSYTCDKLFDGLDHTEWRTLNGQGQDSGVLIHFNSVLYISRIGIKQASVDNGAFKAIEFGFSSGYFQQVNLSNVDHEWNIITLKSPQETTYLHLSMTDYYTPEKLDTFSYYIPELRFYGRLVQGKSPFIKMAKMQSCPVGSEVRSEASCLEATKWAYSLGLNLNEPLGTDSREHIPYQCSVCTRDIKRNDPNDQINFSTNWNSDNANFTSGVFVKICHSHCGNMYQNRGIVCNNIEPCFCNEEICLAGGDCKSGTVLIRGEPLCFDNWDIKDAQVFCRSIGFNGARKATNSSAFTTHSGLFANDVIQCNGDELNIADCQRVRDDKCNSNLFAGVECHFSPNQPSDAFQPTFIPKLPSKGLCIKWREKKGCTASGSPWQQIRVPENDKSCDATIEKGTSGYCECSWGEMTKEKSCNANKGGFTCNEACSELSPITSCFCEHQNGSADGARNGIICFNALGQRKPSGHCKSDELCSGPYIGSENAVGVSKSKSVELCSKN